MSATSLELFTVLQGCEEYIITVHFSPVPPQKNLKAQGKHSQQGVKRVFLNKINWKTMPI